jgi:lipopolysaccharide/colanic/teichoic acid biosynthesis glycosyltransferase
VTSLAIKYAFDRVLAFVLLLLSLPLFAATALAILVTMGRPVFFSQQRAGLHGRPFAMFKFRSMVRGAELDETAWHDPGEASQARVKAKDDPRITPLGRILRRTSLDELPQLLNVLCGSMSLVGPRPLPLDQHRWLRDFQERRLAMKPGITGLWQVSGRSQLEFDDWMALDLEYVERWSLLLDLRILLRTIPVVLSGRGAY